MPLMARPGNGATPLAGQVWAADTGLFGSYGRHYTDAKYLGWLAKWPRETCLFATSPDVVGDAAATLALSAPMFARIRAAGYPVALVAQDGKRDRTIPYEEMYMRLADTDGAAPRLMSLQATLLSRFVVIQPGGEREGLLLFPSLKPEAVYLLLELPSFFVGGRPFPGRLEFQVTH
jgi:hypothetical protein